ncbi:hypothetical protein Atep_09110 [Allochromatium tepidum]|uniref:Uncharacterized protein n=1 Tax=Allochromatium tepidum TaxID=553982 RepID=A0ABM7QKI1_9GAMM|nr:hypothetical protein Atep_09110 [Allochromatium tepidum]
MRVSGRPTEHSLDHHGLYNLATTRCFGSVIVAAGPWVD